MPEAPVAAPTPKKKRIAVFLDGTWNTVNDNTNVWRLRALCAPRSMDGSVQCSYYDAGVGTSFGEIVRGGWLGIGVNENVIDAYQWLIENYNPGDEIFIFGFSRGLKASTTYFCCEWWLPNSETKVNDPDFAKLKHRPYLPQ
jgi:uncharacterized protein (DUF2235 family)